MTNCLFAALTLIVVCIIPIYIHKTSNPIRKEGRLFGHYYIGWTCLLMLISLFLVAFVHSFADESAYLTRYIIIDQAFDAALPASLTIAGFLMLYSIGYYPLSVILTPKATRKKRLSHDYLYRFNNSLLIGIGIAILISSALAVYMAIIGISIHSEESMTFGGPLKSVISIISRFYIQAPALIIPFIYKSNRTKNLTKKIAIYLLLTCLIVGVFVGLKTAVKQGIIMPAAYAFIGLYACGSKIPKLPLVGIVAISFLSLILIQGARIQAGKALENVPMGETIEKSLEYAQKPGAAKGYSLYIATRANLFTPVAQAYRSIAEGYSMPLNSWINPVFFWAPAFIFPTKPDPFDQNQFGQLTQMSDYGQYLTVVRPTHIGESLITGGIIGLLIIGFIVGILIALCERLSTNYLKLSQEAGKIVTCCIWSSFIDIEGPLSYAIGGGLKLILIIACVFIASKIYTSTEKA